MSDEVLDESQVESLLRAMEENGVSEGGASAGTAGKRSTGPGGGGVQHRVNTTVYDFKRPERVGKEQMRAMHTLHEGLARSFGAGVSGLLRTMVEVKLATVDQLTYSEFIYSLDNPSCFSVVQPKPLDGHWILDISPSLSYALIDRMLGGDPSPGDAIRRPLTEIETRLIGRVSTMLLNELKESWENVIDLEFEIERVESNPQLVQIVPPNEVVVLVSLDVSIGKNRGLINLCIPFNTIERFNSKLSNSGWVGYAKSSANEQTRSTVARSVDAAPVKIVVTLARSRIKTSDLLQLSVGDIITTEQEVKDPLEIAIQDVPKLVGRPGSLKGRKAIRIEADTRAKS